MVVVALSACLAFGSVLNTLLEALGLDVVLITFLAALLTSLVRWAFERAKRDIPLPQISVVTSIRILILLANLVAAPILGVGWLLAMLADSDFQAPLLDSLLLVLGGSVVLVSLPLTVIDNSLLLVRMMTRRPAAHLGEQ